MLVDNMFDGYFFINAAQAAADVPRFCVMFDYSFDCNRKNVFDHKLSGAITTCCTSSFRTTKGFFNLWA